jgi:hypothetical protein
MSSVCMCPLLNLPAVGIGWLAFVLRVLEALGTNLDPEKGYAD